MPKDAQAAPRWYRWSPSDFRSDPAVYAMSREQRWLYRDALDSAWLACSGGVGTEAQWRGWFGLSESAWAENREAFMAAFEIAQQERFDGSGVFWTQRRLAEEWAAATKRSASAKVAGVQRGASAALASAEHPLAPRWGAADRVKSIELEKESKTKNAAAVAAAPVGIVDNSQGCPETGDLPKPAHPSAGQAASPQGANGASAGHALALIRDVAKAASGNPSRPVSEPKPGDRPFVAQVDGILKPLPAAVQKQGWALAHWWWKLGVKSPGTITRAVAHYAKAHERIRNPHAFFHPAQEFWKSLAMQLAGEEAAAQAHEMNLASAAFLAGGDHALSHTHD